MGGVPDLAAVLAALDRRYPQSWAEEWDAVGLVCGEPVQPVRRVLFAVDPVDAVAVEAIALGADLLVTHHPLFLAPVHGVAGTTAKGRFVTSLVRGGVALYVAHTNADVAAPGVSDALAGALGLQDLRPLAPSPADPLDKLVTFVPTAGAEAVVDALAAAGAGAIGNYDRCAFTSTGTGTFRPGPGAQPTVGERGRVNRVEESRIEMVLPRHRRGQVVAALRAAHPYEEPAYDVVELALPPGERGFGRVGTLPEPEPLTAFLRRAAAALPATAGGLRSTGDPDRLVHTVAVCGGAGDSLLGQAGAAGADVYLTADLRHHRASEQAEEGGPALVDAAHWATEWPWLASAAALLAADLAGADRTDTVEMTVSSRRTDPWTLHVGRQPADEGQEQASPP
ncbi:MAG: Nif3-like dinuclear metal center hexameric protein [Actinomycetota bacterium]|nr:Nif3-like dinuclear metal center hexameric protein [Actinomycetota bacterium]